MQKVEIIENGTAAERLTALVAHFSKGNKAAFGRVVGIASGVMAGLLGERQSKPGFELLQRILTGFPTISPDWLLFGTGPMLRGDGERLQPVLPEQANPLQLTENETIYGRIARLVRHFNQDKEPAATGVAGLSNQRLGELVVATIRYGVKANDAPKGTQPSQAGPPKEPALAVAGELLATHPTVRAQWLLTGQGPMLRVERAEEVQVEWRFWFPPVLPGTWFIVSSEPDAPRLHGLYAGLVGSGEHAPLLQVQDFYQRAGQRSYVVEVTVPGPYSPGELREQLTASGWSPLPEEARRLTPVELW